MADREKSYILSVRLLKKGVSIDDIKDADFGEAIIDEKSLKGYLLRSKPNLVWWQKYLGLDTEISNYNHSFILFVFVEGRCFAYTFGFGHNKLKPEYIEENFGFLVTLNSVDGSRLKSLELYSPASNTKQRKIVSSILTDIYDYGFNDQQDLINKLVGVVKPEYSELFKNPTGADSLKITTKKSKDELISLSKTLLERFLSEDYKNDENLKSINSIQKASKTVVEVLDNLLLKGLKDRSQDIFLSDYEILGSDEIYTYKLKSIEKPDLCLEDFIDTIDLSDISKLKSQQITLLKPDKKEFNKKWSVYKCLSADFEYEGNHYFLAKGVWYQIEKELLDSIKNIEKYEIKNPLPNALVRKDKDKKERNELEGDYNKRVAATSNDYCLFDKNLATQVHGKGRIEICDIHDKANNIFYHIKNGNNSSTLSHLWNQGVVSEQVANLGDRSYCDTYKKVAKQELQGNRKVYYGIISKSKLPIFSRLALYNAINILKQTGMEDRSIGYFFISTDMK